MFTAITISKLVKVTFSNTRRLILIISKTINRIAAIDIAPYLYLTFEVMEILSYFILYIYDKQLSLPNKN